MKFILSLVLLCVSTQAFKVKLSPNEVDNSIQLKENVLTFDAKSKDGTEIPTVFDLTSAQSWLLEKTTCDKCNDRGPGKFSCDSSNDCKLSDNLQDQPAYGFAGEVQFTGSDQSTTKKIYKTGTSSLEIADQQFKKLDVIFPVDQKSNASQQPQQNLLKTAQASIGLGNAKESFLNSLNKDKFGNVQTESNEFSFFYSEKISQVIFGKPDDFLKTEDWTTFDNEQLDKELSKEAYVLQGKEIKFDDVTIPLKNKDQNAVAQGKNDKYIQQYAILDSTSQFITVQDRSVLDQIINKFNAAPYNAGCVEQQKTNDFYQYYYQCNSDANLPDISFVFEGSDKEFKLTKEDYSEKINAEGTDKLALYLRRGIYQGQSSANSSLQTENFIWLGTKFFNKYYANIKYEENKIQLAEKNPFTPENKNISDNTFYAFLILGILGALAFIGFILSTLSPVPFSGEISKPIPKQVSPRQSQQVIQGQPIYMRTISDLSPQRVLLSYSKPPAQQLIVNSGVRQSYAPPVTYAPAPASRSSLRQSQF